MDLQKLIESQARLDTRSGTPRDAAAAAANALSRPVELQEAQAERVMNRIESLERSRAALIESIDAELTALKSELETRKSGIQAVRERLEGAAKAVAAVAPAPRKRAETLQRDAEEALPARHAPRAKPAKGGKRK